MLEINKKKDIPKKNYFILGIILIISCILVYYINAWYSLYQYEKRGNSPITTYMEIINYNEVENYIEENSDAIIYISKSNNLKIRKFEEDNEKLFKKLELNYNILYMDAKDVNKDLKIKYNVNEYPTILFFKNKRLVNKYVLELDNINYNDIKNIIDYSNGENND
ncbi:MAG: DUF6568 family protein [Bacilli bacterium]|jgi:hypothetical protein|nr:hypothetical protein [Clostridium sp.]MDY3797574.1 DUF6568 family protein [Bacilli bacterium]CDE95576.1 unknown [Clostridium sp. CAG:914]